MQLLTEQLRNSLPPLRSQEHNPNPIVLAKFFTPDSNWTWWVTEGSPDGEDFRFFGFVRGFEDEWGYFFLSELNAIRGPFGLVIERDIFFQAGPFIDVVPAPDS